MSPLFCVLWLHIFVMYRSDIQALENFELDLEEGTYIPRYTAVLETAEKLCCTELMCSMQRVHVQLMAGGREGEIIMHLHDI